MNDLQVFSNTEFGQMRSMTIDDEPWFAGRDVAVSLGYKDPAKAVRVHVDDEDKGVADSSTPGGIQSLVIINESGLYSLILSSKLPSAKRFKRWVTSEVLPAIRKTGKFKTQDAPLELTDQQSVCIRAASIIATCKSGRLPLVLSCLRQAGVEVEGATSYTAGHSEWVSVKALLRNAKRDYGITPAQVAAAVGVEESTMYRYNTGNRNPRKERAEQIAVAIEKLIEAISA